MPSLVHILRPKWQTAIARARQSEGNRGKILILGFVGLLFWFGVFGVLYRILRYFRGVEEIGALLAEKLLSVALLVFLAILLLSNVITALSSFFLAKDLDLLAAAPVDWLNLYLAKLGETMLHSSWMVALMAVPIFTAYGIIYDGGWAFGFLAIVVLLPLLIVPATVGSAITLILVNVFPARRTRDLLTTIAIGGGIGVVVLFRIIRPEQLARPEGFRNLLDFITVLQTPTSPFLPSEWATEAIMGFLVGPFDGFPILLLWSTAAGIVVLGASLHFALYSTGFTKAQEGAERFVKGRVWDMILNPLLKPLSIAKREFVIKDIKVFFRDTTQWSQLILLGVLVVVYLFNIRALPLFSGEQVPFAFLIVILFLNLGLAGFVLASIAARFIFPAISLEGRQMWLLRSSPLDLRALLWSKYWVGTVPLLVLALTITVLSNVLLQVSGFMMAVGIGTIVLLTLAISALALGFGTLFPQFETENAAQIPTSYGGLVFMMTTIALLALVIVIEAIPTYGYLLAQLQGQPIGISLPMVLAFGAVVAVCLGTMVTSLYVGLRKMESFEF